MNRLTTMIAVPLLLVGIHCNRSPEARAEEATRLVRQMSKEISECERKAVVAFKALPEADSIQNEMGKGFEDWVVSEKRLDKDDLVLEQGVVALLSSAKGDGLTVSLRRLVLNLQKGNRSERIRVETRLAEVQKSLAEGKFVEGTWEYVFKGPGDPVRRAQENLRKVIPFEIEVSKEMEKILDRYSAKMEKLLD